MSHLHYGAAAIQTDLPGPINRAQMRRNTDRCVALIDQAVTAYQPLLPIRLVVFPEFAHAAPIYPTLKELRQKLGVEIPNTHIDRLIRKARELDIYIQTGSMLEIDKKYPGALFNTSCLLGPEGFLLKYRKVYTWLPWEVHTSPNDLADYEEELFPVAKTQIGVLGVAICYDWLFPEVLRQLSIKGAEVLIRVSAYMDPYGATPPMDWWTVINRSRAIENMAYVVAANQGASLRNFPPFSWPGGSMVVDYEGRILAQANPGSGEQVVVAPLNVRGLREDRVRRIGHHTLAHLRGDAVDVQLPSFSSKASLQAGDDLSPEDLMERVRKAKSRLERSRRR